MSFPIRNGDFPWQNVSSPEGTSCIFLWFSHGFPMEIHEPPWHQALGAAIHFSAGSAGGGSGDQRKRERSKPVGFFSPVKIYGCLGKISNFIDDVLIFNSLKPTYKEKLIDINH